MKYYIDESSLKLAVKEINDRINDSLLECWEYLQGKLVEQITIDSFDRWNLARSVNYRLVKDWFLSVGTNLDYALVREYWRRPWKLPNLNAISEWTARKGIISWWVNTWYNNLSYQDKWTVFIIARAIATRWIKWKHTFENVYQREKNNIINLFREKMKW